LIVEVRGLPVHVEVVGEGRPLLVLHGFGADHRFGLHRYEPVFRARAGWRRIYPDLPGMGQTPGPAWLTSPEGYVDLLVDFMDALAPGERFALVGISWGAYLALGMTRAVPDRIDGLMLTAPVIRGRGEDRSRPPRFVLRRDPGIDARLAPDEALWTSMAVVQTPTTLEAFRQAVKPGLAVADWEFLQTIAHRFADDVVEDRLPSPLSAPALVVLGKHDVAVGYADAWPLLADLPRGTLAVLDGAGHGVEEEQQGLFRGLASEWLDRVEAWVLDRTEVAR
jgi:pimeloyl-ACP methyl ester carboxylesterase